MNRIMIIILIVGLFSCKKEVEPDTYYCVTAQIVNGTTGDTLYTALPISIDLERNDQYGRPAVPRHITSSKMSAKDGKFSFRYSELKRQQGEGQLLNIKMTIAGGYYFIPVNQNVDTIIYKSNQAHVYIYIYKQRVIPIWIRYIHIIDILLEEYQYSILWFYHTMDYLEIFIY